MIVQCPNCKTKFNLADEKVSEKGIKVRCSKCKYVFEVKKPKEPEPEPEPEKFEFEEEQFDFSEDIDFGEEEISTERAPQTPAHQDYAVRDEEFSFGEDEGFDIGAEEAEEKEPPLGISTDMPEIPDEKEEEFISGDEEFGEEFGEEEFGDFKIDRGTEIPAQTEEEVGEEFDFSEHLESYARTDVPETTPAGGEDELEAKLDIDTEAYSPSEPAPAPSAGVSEPVAPVRAHPAPSPAVEKRGGGLKKFLIFILILIILSPVAGLGYLHITGQYKFSDLLHGDFAKLKQVPAIENLLIKLGLAKPSIKGEVVVLKNTLKVQTLRRKNGRHILVISGEVRNDFNVWVRKIQVVVNLYDKNRNLLAQKYSYCDVSFSKSELLTLSREDIETFMNTRAGRNMLNLEIAPGETRDFAVVFFKIPPGLESYDVKIASYEFLEQAL